MQQGGKTVYGASVGILMLETRFPRIPGDIGNDGGRCFSRDILGDAPEIDLAACRPDMLDAAKTLCSTHPDVGAIVLECTNMVPFATDKARMALLS